VLADYTCNGTALPVIIACNVALSALALSPTYPSNLMIQQASQSSGWGSALNLGQSIPSQGGVAMIEFNNTLYMAFIGIGQAINLWSSTNGTDWDNQTILPYASSNPPALAVYKNQLCLAFIGNGANNTVEYGVYTCTSENGSTFSSAVQFGTNTSNAGPALAVAGGLLCLGFIGQNDQLNYGSSSNGTSFGNQVIPDIYGTSDVNPSLVVSGNNLLFAFAANSTNTSSYDPSLASEGLAICSAPLESSGIGNFGAPSFAVNSAVGGNLSLVATTDEVYGVWVNGSNIVLWEQSTGTTTNLTLGAQPALALFNNQLNLAYTAMQS
jgi:hypothetical protein